MAVTTEGVSAENDYSQCTSAADRSASCCRSLVLIVSFLNQNLFIHSCRLVNLLSKEKYKLNVYPSCLVGLQENV